MDDKKNNQSEAMEVSTTPIVADETLKQLAEILPNHHGKLGSDEDGNTGCREVYMEISVHDAGEIVKQKVEIPLRNIVPIPFLQIDDMNVDFQMEVAEASGSNDSDNMRLPGKGKNTR